MRIMDLLAFVNNLRILEEKKRMIDYPKEMLNFYSQGEDKIWFNSKGSKTAKEIICQPRWVKYIKAENKYEGVHTLRSG